MLFPLSGLFVHVAAALWGKFGLNPWLTLHLLGSPPGGSHAQLQRAARSKFLPQLSSQQELSACLLKE